MEGPAGWPPGSAPHPGNPPPPPPPPPPHPGYPAPGGFGAPPAYPGYPGYPLYPGQPGTPGYGPPPQPAQARRSRRPGRPWHRRPIVYIAIALVALVAAAVVFFLITSSPPISADEKGLIGQCVTVTGNAVQLVDCGKAHVGRITAVAQRYDACPSGTSAFRIHSGVSNDHSGCYVSDVTGAQ